MSEQQESSSEENWYILYGGTSADGLGPSKFIGRTTDRDIAMEHYLAIRNDPYSTGKVVIITNDREITMV